MPPSAMCLHHPVITGALTGAVDFSSRLPYYTQLRNSLVDQIRGLPPHTALPSEKELETHYGVSRTVVRQALKELEHEDAIYRRKGKGSYVAPTKVAQGRIQSLTSFTSEMSRLGVQTSTLALEQCIVPASGAIAAHLRIEEGSPVLRLLRLRRIEDEPLMVTTTHLPSDLFPGLEAVDLGRASLYELMSTRYKQMIVRSTRTLDAVAADRKTAEMLHIGVRSPLVRLEIKSFAESGRVIEHSIAYHRGDRSRFEFEVINPQYVGTIESDAIDRDER